CFFQAEDGIRDATVTGVQTCALPIYIRRKKPSISPFIWDRHPRRSRSTFDDLRRGERARMPVLCKKNSRPLSATGKRARRSHLRSEERRVGKEWTSGRWRDDDNRAPW